MRIKWGDGRGKRASYNRQELLWSFVAPGEGELSPSPASVLIAVMSLLHRQQRHILGSSCMPGTNTAHALPPFAAPRTTVIVPFLQLREMRHSGDLSRVTQLVGDRSRLEPSESIPESRLLTERLLASIPTGKMPTCPWSRQPVESAKQPKQLLVFFLSVASLKLVAQGLHVSSSW